MPRRPAKRAKSAMKLHIARSELETVIPSEAMGSIIRSRLAQLAVQEIEYARLEKCVSDCTEMVAARQYHRARIAHGVS